MRIGVPTETFPGERRVALIPAAVAPLRKAGLDVVVQSGAGREAGFPDEQYREAGCEVAPDRAAIFGMCDVILQVRTVGANPERGREELQMLRRSQVNIGFVEPLTAPELNRTIADRGVILFGMELIPRITRAQSMDALSSMASIAGYKAVLLAANALPKMFPMMMTAAGTIRPARVFVVGAGVAGLQAIATANRLGAVVHAYDVRPAVKEQIQSLGGKFVELPLEAAGAETRSGYARALGEEFYQKQRELMSRVVAESDVVITTAAVPGKKAPVLVTAAMIHGMAPGSVVVDLAAERGGNCELTRAGETIDVNGVTIMGPINLPATVPYHASQMYARNISTFLLHLVKDGQLQIRLDDEITRETLVCRDGQILHPRVRELLGMTPDGDGTPASPESSTVPAPPDASADARPSPRTPPAGGRSTS